MDVIVYLKNGQIYDYSDILFIREECNIYLYLYDKQDDEVYKFRMSEIAMIKIKGGYDEHKEGQFLQQGLFP